MALINRKITTYAKDVSALSNTPNDDGMTAEQLKAVFMGAAKEEIKTSVNGIVDDLVATADGASGADQIGSTALKSGGAITVRGQLEEVKTDSALALSGHTSNSSNPHSVNKTQVGLGNVDNTSDADKPVSTAQAAALDSAVDTLETTISDVDTSTLHKSGDETATGTKTFDDVKVVQNVDLAGYIFNSSSANNSKIQPSTTGAVITRNVSDSNPALVVNQANSSSHGDVIRGQIAGTTKFVFTQGALMGINIATPTTAQLVVKSDGILAAMHVLDTSGSPVLLINSAGAITNKSNINTTGVIYNTSQSYGTIVPATSTAGVTVTRNVADANAALTVNQINASSTGNILDLQAAGTNVVTVDHSGITAFSVSPTVPTPTADTQVANKAYVDDTADTLVPISSIVNDLTTGGADRPLSAEQGKIATSIPDVATLKTYSRSLKAENDHLVLTLSEIV